MSASHVDSSGPAPENFSHGNSAGPNDRAKKPSGSAFSALGKLAGPIFFPLALVARLPLGMLTIGSITFVVSTTGSYTAGGIAAALVGIGSAVGSPLSGAISDARGQRGVLLALAVLHVVSLALLLVFGFQEGAAFTASGATVATPWMTWLASLLAGASCAQVGPMSRSRWVGLTNGRVTQGRELNAALGYESTVDEITFALGPAIVGLVAALVTPWMPLVISGAITAILVPAFALHRTAHAAPRRQKGQVAAAWTTRQALGVSLATITMMGLGTIFGSTASGTLAFADHMGIPSGGGLIYAALGSISAITALSVVAWPSSFKLTSRWLVAAIVLVPATLLLQFADSVPLVLIALACIGLPIGPILVTMFAFGNTMTPHGRLGFVMGLLASGITIGTSIGNSLAGFFADTSGYEASYQIALVAAIVILAAAAAAVAISGKYRRKEHA